MTRPALMHPAFVQRHCRVVTVVLALAMVTLAFADTPAQAIPSPELIVGSAASLSQLAALITATFGGGAVLAGAVAGQQRGARTAWRAAGLAVAVGAGLVMALIWSSTRNAAEQQARLEASLLRPARQPGQVNTDPTLKELSYAGQLQHPLGLTTAAVAQLVASADAQTVIVDVREDAEIAMGTLIGAKTIRYPDFQADDATLQGKTLVFFCHNGNRSHETCEVLKAQGIDCRFIVGGLEKWVVEQRPMTGLGQRTLSALRAIPEYPNRNHLLDTPAVRTLVESRGAQFIDVRYPAEFAAGHLPAAINVPVRRLSRLLLDRALVDLPKRPVILPCSDRRSCFFAEVLGLELHRAGHEVLGRYTVPFEYFVAVPRPPHVDAWIAENQKSLWQRARDGLAVWLDHVAMTWTGLPLALLLLALASRAVILPFALKSDRDQLVLRATEAELEALKTRLARDPVRRARALRAFYRRHQLTPVRNLLALAFLPLLAAAVGAAGDAARLHPSGFVWLLDLSLADATLVLPAMFALVLTGYCIAAFARTRRQRLLTAVIGLPILVGSTISLPAASTLYLLISALLLVAQRVLVSGWPTQMLRRAVRAWHATQARRLAGAMPLAVLGERADVGNKARRLAQLTAAGVPVPAGVVLDYAALRRFSAMPASAQQRYAKKLWRHLGRAPLAVRSSAAGEDGGVTSFAGVFDSVLDVERDGLAAALRRVAASFNSARATAYGAAAGQPNILVQLMVRARYAGVLFTRAPDAPGQMLVELTAGTGDGLVSGRITPRRYRLGRVTGAVFGTAGRAPERPPIDLLPLVALGQQIERLFGCAQDIEWAFADDRFQILQSRDITADLMVPAIVAETEVLLRRAGGAAPDALLLVKPTMTELLPRPTPVSLALLNALWAPGGSVDQACRRLAIAYPGEDGDPDLYVTAFGRLMANAAVQAKLTPRLSVRQSRALLARAGALAARTRDEVLPRRRAEAVLLAALDLTALTVGDLQSLWQRQLDAYVTDVHPDAEVINMLAELVSRQPGAAPATAALRPVWQQHAAALAAVDPSLMSHGARAQALQRLAGHRAQLDYELSEPRLSETPGALGIYAASLASSPHASAHQTRVLPRAGSAEDLAALKEDAKHEVLRFQSELRRLLLELDRRFALGGMIFMLTLDEIATLAPTTVVMLRARASANQHNRTRLLEEPSLGSRVTVADLERIGAPRPLPPSLLPGTLGRQDRCKGHGTRVAGRAEVTGRVFVATAEQAETGHALPGFRDGDVLVAEMVHPDWLDVVLRSGGVIVEIGGWLSHMAIVAREHDVPMIVGLPNGGQLRTGEYVRLMTDGRVLADPEPVVRLSVVAAT